MVHPPVGATAGFPEQGRPLNLPLTVNGAAFSFPNFRFTSCHGAVTSEVSFAQSRLTLCDPTDCSPPGSSVRGILQARTLEGVAIPFSRRSSQPRAQTQVSCTAGRFSAI